MKLFIRFQMSMVQPLEFEKEWLYQHHTGHVITYAIEATPRVPFY